MFWLFQFWLFVFLLIISVLLHFGCWSVGQATHRIYLVFMEAFTYWSVLFVFADCGLGWKGLLWCGVLLTQIVLGILRALLLSPFWCFRIVNIVFGNRLLFFVVAGGFGWIYGQLLKESGGVIVLILNLFESLFLSCLWDDRFHCSSLGIGFSSFFVKVII